jgi:DNA primase
MTSPDPRGAQSDFKERVRAATDIVELVGQYVKLRRTGSNWQGLCPFHHENSPSFNVNQERQNFYCFGCAKGGDVFSFVMEQEGLAFREALEHLARRAGIPIETARGSGGESTRTELYQRINAASADFYARQLREAPAAARARDYLRRRGVDEAAWADWSLGYAGESWRDLHQQLSRQGFPDERCEELGLIRRKAAAPKRASKRQVSRARSNSSRATPQRRRVATKTAKHRKSLRTGKARR